ncbi:MAG: TolC family protein [Sphingobacteriales bacterium]|nr:MAG: TolC family protein [Sphingobacteriales bacterium]
MLIRIVCRCALALLLLSLCAPCIAQQNSLRLKDLLAAVRSNAPSLQTDSASVRIRQAQEEAVRINRLPALRLNYQVNAGTNNNLPGGYFANGIVPGNSRVRIEGNSSTALGDLGIAGFDWEIYNFGKFEAEKDAVHADLLTEQFKLEQSKYNLQAYTISYYLQLLRLGNLLSIQSLNIDRNSEIRRSIQSLAQSGIIAGVDTSIAEAELSKARLNYLELSNQFRQVQLLLGTISGIDPATIIPDTLFTQKLLSYYAFESTAVFDTASHPSIQFYQSIYNSSQLKERLIEKSYNPKVLLQGAVWGRGSSISAADQFRDLSKGLGFERGNYLVGVGVTYNIFDNKRKKLQLTTQKASTVYAAKELDEQRALLDLSIRQSEADLQISLERLREIPHQLEAAQAAYRQKLSLYKNGLTNIVDLNAAVSLLYRAETDYINANYNYCKALFQKAVNENQVDALLNSLN